MKIESRPTSLGAAVEKCVVLIVLREVRSILKRVSVKLEARKRYEPVRASWVIERG